MSEERDDLIVLVDEDGEETEFEHIDTIEMRGNEYVVLMPYNADDEEKANDEEEVVILKIDHGEDGEDSFVTVEDEEELDDVFEEFKNRIEEYGDEEEED